MKAKIKIAVIVFSFFITKTYAQHEKPFKKLPPEKRKEILQNLKPEQKMELLRMQRQKKLLQELNLPKEKEAIFLEVLEKYHEKQREIHKKYRPNIPPHLLTEEQAKEEIEKNYKMGVELLEIRKKYTQKFLQIISAKQLLKMYHFERKWMQKVNQQKRMREEE